MPKTTGNRSVESLGGSKLTCPTCSAEITGSEKTRWKRDGRYQPLPVVHCEGSKAAYGCDSREPHHTSEKLPVCWKCGADMGCRVCVISDPLCKRCLVYTTEDAYLHNGNLSNDCRSVDARGGRRAPDWSEYPPHWRFRYEQLTQCDRSKSDNDLRQEWETLRGFVGNRVAKTMPQEASKAQRQYERNRQVEALATRQPGED